MTKLLRLSSSKGVTSDNQTIHASLHLKLGCLLFPTGSLKSGTTLQEWGVGEGKLSFSPFEVSEMTSNEGAYDLKTNLI